MMVDLAVTGLTYLAAIAAAHAGSQLTAYLHGRLARRGKGKP